jgi:putative ABC transport system permease protein
MYSSYAQGTWPRLSIGVRAAGDPAAMSKLLSAQIAAVDRDLPVANIQTMEQVVANTLAQRKETMYLIAGFAGLALVLAAIGLYGVMAYSVAQRTAEIGIRQAIGAQRADILRMVMLQGLRLSLAGIVVGTAAAAVLMRLIARMLFQVSATDPVTFAIIAAMLVAVGLAASYVPARRATRVDPVVALYGSPR